MVMSYVANAGTLVNDKPRTCARTNLIADLPAADAEGTPAGRQAQWPEPFIERPQRT